MYFHHIKVKPLLCIFCCLKLDQIMKFLIMIAMKICLGGLILVFYYRIVQKFGGANLWRMKLENILFGW